MSKKIKNIKSKEANKRRNEISSKLADFNIKPEDNLLCIGIILKDFFGSELIDQINKICAQYIGIDFAIFVHNNNSIISNICPILNLNAIILWDYPLITTDISTTKTGMISKSRNIYFLMKDIEIVPEEILQDKRVKLVFSTQNMLDIVIKNPKIKNGIVINNFDMTELIRLINKDLNNST